MRKITSILLLAAMLLSMAACGQADTGTDTAETAADAQTEAVTETEETRAMHEVPELDFGGEEFNILYPQWQGYRF